MGKQVAMSRPPESHTAPVDHAPVDHAPVDHAPGDHAPGDNAPGDRPERKSRLARAASGLLIGLVRLYQWTLSPLMVLLGVQCRFQPTCSHYFVAAVQKYGPLRGGWRGIKRLGRCHPWHSGGYDPP